MGYDDREYLTACAVVGMSGRFPRAADVEGLWRLLEAGEEGLRPLTDEELTAAGIPEELIHDPRYVRARALVEDVDRFDAPFFDLPPREAEILDPQQRLFLEVAWAALEDAGYAPERFDGHIGVFAGTELSTYLLVNLLPVPGLVPRLGNFQVLTANSSDFLPTRVSYKLGLTGPSVNVQTACSTSLVAVHLACQSLLSSECDMALAGGASLNMPQHAGYLYEEQGISSPDGHCRVFDAEARGTARGEGVACVALKRLDDALADGDTIRAIVRGTAIGNDGSRKAGFTAPGVEGQARVIREALAVAGVDPASVSYVEAHGTGTAVGDPIEVAALHQVFGRGAGPGTCALGSLKSNLGHLGAAAGIAGLIKAVLALERAAIPASLHFRRPNPKIDFDAGPFRVAAETAPWPAGSSPRRAGVSSFGIGGTNAHAVLEEAPPRPAPEASAEGAAEESVLALSARTPRALDAAAERLAERLGGIEPAALPDASFTLFEGRRRFRCRLLVFCRGPEEAREALSGRDPERVVTAEDGADRRRVAFLLPGQGSQRLGMAADLHASEPLFKEEIDRCAAKLEGPLGFDLREVLLAGSPGDGDGDRRLADTAVAQPALFTVELALSRLLASWGVEPVALLGHSLGELVAATLAGVFEPDAALELVAARGRLMSGLPPGAMSSVALSENELDRALAGWPELALAAVNAPALCTVSGSEEAVARFEEEMERRGVACRRLATSHAFHSPRVEPIRQEFERRVEACGPRPPKVPFLSNVTGAAIAASDAVDPAYWSRQLRAPVRFAKGARSLLEGTGAALLEVGPGRALGNFCRQQEGEVAVLPRITTLPPPGSGISGATHLRRALGRLWLAGVDLDWRAVFGPDRRRVPLPTYPFERRRYWVEPPGGARPLSMGGAEGLAAHGPEAAPATAPGEAADRTASHERPADLVSSYEAPRNEIEEAVAEIWSDLLGIDRVGVHDDFFDLGGQSLLGTQVLSRLQERYSVGLTLDQMFGRPTVAGLAEAVETRLIEQLIEGDSIPGR